MKVITKQVNILLNKIKAIKVINKEERFNEEDSK